MWFSKTKKIGQTQIAISDIDEICNGQKTATFARHRAPELVRSSFSVIYNRRRASLDLIAKDLNEYRIWTTGLRMLVDMVRTARTNEVRSLKDLVVSTTITRGRRSSIELKDWETGELADDQDSLVARWNPRGNLWAGNKQMHKPVAKNFVALKKKLTRKRRKLEAKVYLRHWLHNNMQDVVRKVQASVDRIQEWFADGDYGQCDDEIWRAGIDLEVLSNMMAAAKRSG